MYKIILFLFVLITPERSYLSQGNEYLSREKLETMAEYVVLVSLSKTEKVKETTSFFNSKTMQEEKYTYERSKHLFKIEKIVKNGENKLKVGEVISVFNGNDTQRSQVEQIYKATGTSKIPIYATPAEGKSLGEFKNPFLIYIRATVSEDESIQTYFSVGELLGLESH